MVTQERLKSLKDLQKKLGVHLQDIDLLNQALTHSSYAKSLSKENVPDNERLEFLGDAVLELITTKYLFKKYSHFNEGELSKLRSKIVSKENLSHQARRIGIGKYLMVGKDQEEIKSQDAPLADAYEAVIGAIYLDRGLEVTEEFIFNLLTDEKEDLKKMQDFKSLLQEYSQSMHKVIPKYKVIQEIGPDHKKKFRVKVKIGKVVSGEGWGISKKKAEKMAAQDAWEKVKLKEEE